MKSIPRGEVNRTPNRLELRPVDIGMRRQSDLIISHWCESHTGAIVDGDHRLPIIQPSVPIQDHATGPGIGAQPYDRTSANPISLE